MRLESFVCWKWKPHRGYRSTFGPETVNTLAAMVRRHYPDPHRFICVTDDPQGIDPAIEIVPLWNDYADLVNPFGHPRNPSCYRRLRLYHPEAAQWFGARFLSIDLDVVILGDLAPIVDRPDDFVIWGDTNPRTLYNSSLTLLTAGARSQVWTEFDPKTSPKKARAALQYGSDQGWVSYCLGKGEAMWTAKHGVYSYRNEVQPNGDRLPANARVVVFHGHIDPWSRAGQAIPWVREHYHAREAVAS